MKYVTLLQGTDFRRIAQIMTRKKFVMNHATARNVLMSSLANLIQNIAGELTIDVSDVQMKKILRSQEVHEALSEILFQSYKELQAEKASKENAV